MLGVGIVVPDELFQPGHGGNTGRGRFVNQHRGVEIARGEHRGDVTEVHPDLIYASFVGRVFGADADFSCEKPITCSPRWTTPCWEFGLCGFCIRIAANKKIKGCMAMLL